MKHDYEQTFRLKHNESPAKINRETGEVLELKKPHQAYRKRDEEDDRIVFESKAMFTKTYTMAWTYLNRVLEPHEYKAAHRLALKAKAYTNSLEPLNDETVITVLVEELGISKNRVKVVLKKLFELGVYGKFEVANPNKEYTKFWILNPYLSFNGKVISQSITNLFKDTTIAKAFRGEIK